MFERLRYFQEVVRQNSFTEAAYICNISQSAISQHIAALERELGYPLLIRRHRSFELTEAGRYFYDNIGVLLEDADRILRETERIAHPIENLLRVGILSGIESYCLPAVAEFRNLFPSVELELYFGDHEQIFQRLRQDALDLVINDQRRAFSNAYRNHVLCTLPWKIDTGKPEQTDILPLHAFRFVPCIVLSDSPAERQFLVDVLGLEGPVRKADSPEQAHLLAAGGSGIYPCTTQRAFPLLQKEGQILTRTLCCFSKAWNQKESLTDFVSLLDKKIKSIAVES